MSPSYDKFSRPSVAAARADSTARPRTAVPADDVYFSLQLNTLRNIDERSQTYELDVVLRTIWYDSRLAHDASCLVDTDFPYPGRHLDELWHPDIGTDSLVKPEDEIASTFWINAQGQLWHARRALWKLKCVPAMNFTDMPFDTQSCRMVIEDFSNTATAVRLDFPNLTGLAGGLRTICSSPEVAGGSIEWVVTNIHAASLSTHGQSVTVTSRLEYHVSLTRRPEHYLFYHVMPICLVVAIAWSSFWLPRAAVPARVSCVVVAYLTLSGIINAIKAQLPAISGSVWLLDFALVSQYFAFGAVLLTALTTFIGRVEQRVDKAVAAAVAAAKSRGARSLPVVGRTPDSGEEVEAPPGEAAEVTKARAALGPIGRCMLTATGDVCVRDQHPDICCRFAFPLLYAVVLASFFARMPTQPGQQPFLVEACNNTT